MANYRLSVRFRSHCAGASRGSSEGRNTTCFLPQWSSREPSPLPYSYSETGRRFKRSNVPFLMVRLDAEVVFGHYWDLSGARNEWEWDR
ncbi:hypothetical protein CDAR_468241 [Caerostris darwini]|uniref:Uncharacterized protein n=1 Tax=Caerostris darwini TaxID=1538125 RepID=A0AAV4WV92_9ARAC|nr:hypothetical protein CDAR_468241 [Caerostris darwini]